MNPAVDRTVQVDRLVFEDRGYILATSEDAGGRGLNASRVIHSFGGKTLAVLAAGGKQGDKIERYLSNAGFRSQLVRLKHDSRNNLIISDKQGLTIKLNEMGPPIEPSELSQLFEAVETAIRKAKWLMICGSIPPGVPAQFYPELIMMAKERGVETLVDTDGDALRYAIEARPTVVTPNQLEAERLLNRALLTRSQCLEAAVQIHHMGAQSVILSLGGRGAIGITQNETWELIPPRIDALSPIGSGDAMAAAFVWAMDRKKPFADALRWGVAAGTASARLPGMQFANMPQAREIYRHVEVRSAQ